MNSIFDPIIIIENKNKQAFGTFDGLTKREYIATQVLNGLLANCVNGFPETIYTIKQSIEYTDELLKQLAE
jgi:uncharacterized protein involved in tolerance to divalent cations